MRKFFALFTMPLIWFSALTACHSALFAQDPGTVIDIVLYSNGKVITAEKECNGYTILHRKSMNWAGPDSNGAERFVPYSLYGRYKKDFSIFSWDPYHQEVIQLCIVHGADSMMVSIQDSIKYWWNAFFYFEIPFSKGYYEITKLEYRSDIKGTTGLNHGYAIPSSYKWEAIPAKKRKLLINGN
jgi:hypothetical protein